MSSIKSRLPEFLAAIEADFERSLQFWLRHSHDEEYGGFFICLDADGNRYDDVKYSWLESRQVWMYSRLYNEVQKCHKPDILKAAVEGAEFLMKYVKDPKSWRCCLSLTRDGKPIKFQRNIFSEVFYLMAMSEVGCATGEQKYKDEALTMMDKILHWVREDDSELGRPKLPGAMPANTLVVPLMVLFLIDQLTTMDASLTQKYSSTTDWCLQQIQAHVQRDGTVVLENVSLDGKELPGCQGRLMNPGHAIEAGWILLQQAVKMGNENLKKIALDAFITQSFKNGWDKKYGGIFSFLDADCKSPTQLEWDMKMWWPHNEAMIAFLMAYKITGQEEHLERFAQVFDYSYSHFVDKEKGEWFGYLNRQGEISLNFKGGPWKGFFHVPRFQIMCLTMLRELMKGN